MPWAPKKPCTQPGCGALVDKGRCEKHTKQQRKQSDARRPSPSRRGYGRTWEKLRVMVLRRQPCCPCGQPAVHVHHLVPKPEGDDSFENLQALCHSCHSAETGRSHGFRKDG